MKPSLRILAVLAVIGLPVVFPLDASAAKTAFRITDLDLRDPHIYISSLGCRDVTDTPYLGFSYNGELQGQITGDSDGDGKLDLSYLIIFDPLNQAGSGGTLTFGRACCTAPTAGTSCEPDSLVTPGSYSYTNMATTCLGVLTGTVRPYTPAVTPSSAPCFVAFVDNMTLDFFYGVPVSNAFLAATYVGSPAGNLVNGLLRVFLSRSDADATFIPNSTPLIGGQPVSILLPDGPSGGNCATHDDRDIGPGGVSGWYMYFNFTAAEVPYTEPPTAVREVAARVWLGDAHPNPFNPSTSLPYALPSAGRARLEVYDVEGRLVRRLIDAHRAAGGHAAVWDGRDDRGDVVTSGVYFARLEHADEVRVRKLTLLK